VFKTWGGGPQYYGAVRCNVAGIGDEIALATMWVDNRALGDLRVRAQHTEPVVMTNQPRKATIQVGASYATSDGQCFGAGVDIWVAGVGVP